MKNSFDNSSKELAGYIFDERWIRLSLIHSGIFILEGESLSPQRYKSDCARLRQILISARKRRAPRFFTRFIIVPVYCAAAFPESVYEHLYGESRETLEQVEIHPVLFDSENQKILAKEAVQNETILIYPYLEKLFAQGEARARSILGGNSK